MPVTPVAVISVTQVTRQKLLCRTILPGRMTRRLLAAVLGGAKNAAWPRYRVVIEWVPVRQYEADGQRF
jgi:hypothetical protein